MTPIPTRVLDSLARLPANEARQIIDDEQFKRQRTQPRPTNVRDNLTTPVLSKPSNFTTGGDRHDFVPGPSIPTMADVLATRTNYIDSQLKERGFTRHESLDSLAKAIRGER